MADNELQKATVDVPLGELNSRPPGHAGPTGRLTDLVDVEINQYAGAGEGKRIVAGPRRAFSSFSDTLRNSGSGVPESGTWADPTFLRELGDQLLSICSNRPRVWTGSAWANYGSVRVVTQKLSEAVIHATNGTVAACDHAWIAGVTCFTWTEQSFDTDDGETVLNTSFWVGIRADDGAWKHTPERLYTALGADDKYELGRVVTDGELFWVFYNAEIASAQKLFVDAYDVNGVRVASTNVPRKWIFTPANWDIYGSFQAGVILAQPDGIPADPGDDVGVLLTRFTEDSGTISTEDSSIDAHCQAQVAWATVDTSGTDVYLITLGPAEAAAGHFWVYEIDDDLEISFEYDTTTAPLTLPDSMTGWPVEVSAGVRDVYVSWSELASEYTDGGPPFDPALRFTRTIKRTHAGVTTTIKQENSVILQSRAFAIDSEYYAYTYYQSGSGQLLPTAAFDVDCTTGDYLIGSRLQPLTFAGGATYGAPLPLGGTLIVVQDGAPSANIDGGGTPDKVEQIVASGIFGVPDGTPVLKWTFKNAPFPNVTTFGFPPGAGTILKIASCTTIPTANGNWDMFSATSITVAYTSITSRTGGSVAPGNFGTDGTAETLSTTFYPIDNLADFITTDVVSFFDNGTIEVAGSTDPGNNDTFTLLIGRLNISNFGIGIFASTPGVWVLTTTQTTDSGAFSFTVSSAQPGRWAFGTPPIPFYEIDEGGFLEVTGAQRPTNNNSDGFTITDHDSTGLITGDPDAAATVAEIFYSSALPTVTVRVQSDLTPMTLHVAAMTADYTYFGALVSVAVGIPGTDGVYKITDVIDAQNVILERTDGSATTRSYSFHSEQTITIQLQGNVQPQTQPEWFVTPLTGSQPQVGAFEKGLAYADWRFDGEETVDQNRYRFALSSTSNPFGTIRQVVLPFRVGTFTQVSIATVGATAINIANASLASTVGLKLFRSQGRGEGIGDAGKLLVPGLLAAEFTSSGFAENNFNVGPESPFQISQESDAGAFALTPKAVYVYQLTVSRTLENGDTVRSIPSGASTIKLTGDNNVVNLGGRLINPLDTGGLAVSGHYGVSNHATIAYEIWRTVVVDGVPSTQLHLVTNPGSPNALYSGTGTGSGFTFPDENTWNYRDENPDAGIRATEVIYAGSSGQGIAPHFPAPPFTHATTWANRRWVVGYDGAAWMSAELVEGEDPWFFPGFRYPFPPEDPAVCVVGFENFLFILCAKSIWRVPFVQLPNATLTAGSLPSPIKLPIAMGCSGFAVACTDFVAYSSSVDSRQIWAITRDLANVYLSEPIVIDTPIADMAVDGRQRLLVTADDFKLRVYDPVARQWYTWRLVSQPIVLATYQGKPTYEDAEFVNQQTESGIVDERDDEETPVPIDVTFSSLSFAQVRAVKRLWEAQIVGTNNGDCNINAEISYPDDSTATTTEFGPTRVVDDPVMLAINPAEEDATSFTIRIFGSYEDIDDPGRCFSLEMICCEVGLDARQGLRKLPNGFRLVSNG